MARPPRLTRLLVPLPAAFIALLTGTANADSAPVTVTIYDNSTADNLYNNAPPLPPTTPIAGQTTQQTIDNNFDQQPLYNLYEDFVVRYETNVAAPGPVRFYAPADDGVRLYIDGQLVIDDWYDKGGGGSISETVEFEPGVSHTLEMWFYENGGGAWVQLWWEVDGQFQPVPASAYSATAVAPTTTTSSTTSTTSTTVSPTTTTTTEPPTTVPPTTAAPETTTTATTQPTTTTSVQSTTSTTSSTTSSTTPTTTTTVQSTTTTVASTTTTAVPTVPEEPTAEQAAAIATDRAAVAALDEDQAAAVFAALDIDTLDTAELAALVDAVQQAPAAVRAAFEQEINVFDGATDSYIPLGSTVPVSTRRALVAVGAVLSAAAVPVRVR